METNYYVYKHTNKVNGKIYIGITCQRPKQRWHNGKGYKKNNHFWHSIKKYGWNKGFDHEILYSGLSQRQAEVMEVSLIAYYDSTNQNKGYNISLGGGLQSKETRQKMSESHKGENNPMYGKTHTEETKQKISEATKGENNPMYGRTGENSPMYGKTGHNHPKSKSVICITTGQCFGSTEEAARLLNLKSSGNIRNCCRGRYKSSGTLPDGTKLVWKYISDLPRPQLTDSDKVHLRDLLDKYSA
jgi:group I intron endonuclease